MKNKYNFSAALADKIEQQDIILPGTKKDMCALLDALTEQTIKTESTDAYIKLLHPICGEIGRIAFSTHYGGAPYLYLDFAADKIRKMEASSTERQHKTRYRAFNIYYDRLTRSIGVENSMNVDMKESEGLPFTELYSKRDIWFSSIDFYIKNFNAK